MRGKYIVGGLVIFAVVVGLYWVLVPMRDTPDIPSESSSEIALINFTYEKPQWLAGHPKQENIEEYVKKRKEEITNGAIEHEREFPESRALLPYVLEITIERLVLDAYESILITDYAYTGGAHGNTIYAYYTLRDGKDVSLTEYLSDRGYSKEHLLELVNKGIVRDTKNKYKTIESFNDVAWQVHAPDSEKPIGIRIIFPPGTIEAYAAGTITYTF